MINHSQLLNHLSIGVAVIDRSLRIVFWNRWMAEHSMLSSAEVTGHPIQEVFPTLVKKGLVKKAHDVFRTGHPSFFNKNLHKNIFPFYSGRSYIEKKLLPMDQTVILSPLLDSSGNTSEVLISVLDISDWISYQNELLRSQNDLQLLSQTDDLTQIPNRRNIMSRLTEELQIHKRKKRPLSMALLDIDHFKLINDNHGHQTGDIILRDMAQLVSRMLREYDVMGRYGGEEFLIVLPETCGEQAFKIADRVREAVAAHEFPVNRQVHRITVSLGVTCKKAEETPTLEELFKETDRCLYLAKESGRNRTEIAEPPPPGD
ncbi:MAG: GGDEF domain-containing protein [Desulfobulbaceae bacterium]|nr:GGDEF domain-containing protein [Desulfobulbaceae bacterium]